MPPAGRPQGRVARRQRFGAVLFDLDGTLAETRRDIATAVNLMLGERGLPELAVDRVARHVGRGARVLVTRSIEESTGGRTPEPAEVDRAYGSFHAHYLAHLLDHSHVYPGIEELLARLGGAGVAMGVVTNKPVAPARKILDALGLAPNFAIVLGGESLPQRKPDPGPLLHAREALGAGERAALMVGDSEIDIAAARAAGFPVAAVTWGFLSRELLAAASPDFLADDAAALGDWILR